MKANVYVGTYKKYNEGKLSGGWVSIADCKNYSEFINRCVQLHKDEEEPEFMIQDSENFPDGLSCMEWIDEKEFNDIKEAIFDSENDFEPKFNIIDYSDKVIAVIGDTYSIKEELKRMGGKFNSHLRCGAGWIFSKSKKAELESLVSGGCCISANSSRKEENKFEMWLKEFIDTLSETDKKFYSKQYIGAVKVSDKYLLLEKQNIENRFCFHDEGPDYDFYKTLSDEKKLEAYFLKENTKKLKNILSEINKGKRLFICGNSRNQSAYYNIPYYDWKDESCNGKEATKEERDLFVEGINFSLNHFTKRLNTYLKRYGVSKLHTWTYWADA